MAEPQRLTIALFLVLRVSLYLVPAVCPEPHAVDLVVETRLSLQVFEAGASCTTRFLPSRLRTSEAAVKC